MGNETLDELRTLNTNTVALNSTMLNVLAKLAKIEENQTNASL